MGRAMAEHDAQVPRRPAEPPPLPDQREQFIPIRKVDLLEALCAEPCLSPHEASDFRRLAELIQAVFHHRYHLTLEELKEAYDYFNPDIVTPPRAELSAAEKTQRLDLFIDKFGRVLERGANFKRLGRAELDAALAESSAWGLNLVVDFDAFDRLELFARGDVAGTRGLRRWQNLYRLEEIEVPIYQRLVVLFKLRPHKGLGEGVDTESLYIKCFKDIPKVDLEMLLPATRVKMTGMDRVKIILPTVSGLFVTIWKLITGAIVLLATNILAFLGLVGGTIGYGVKSLYGYVRTKQKYQLSLTKSLYYLNLANNAGVLFRLFDEAEEQECCEVMLSYWFLWKRAGDDGWTEDELDQRCEAYLLELTGRDVDFELPDALDKLRTLEMVTQTPDGRLHAVPLPVAYRAIDRAWDNLFDYDAGQARGGDSGEGEAAS